MLIPENKFRKSLNKLDTEKSISYKTAQ